MKRLVLLNKNKYLILLSFLFVGLFISDSALAQGLVQCAGGKNACTLGDLFATLIRIINFLVGLAWLVAILLVFWGSYGLATSYGNSEKIEGAKGVIQKAIIGFFLIMVAFILINWLVLVLGGFTFQEMLGFLPFSRR